jgi:hypothetical protein
MSVRIGAQFPHDEILPGINNVHTNRVTSILSIVPAWKPLIRLLDNLRLLSRILGLASCFRRLSSENAAISAVGVTSTLTIETFIAKSDDISYCLQDNCNTIWQHEWCNIKQQTQCTANEKKCFTRSGLSGWILCGGSLVATRPVVSWLWYVFVAGRCGTNRPCHVGCRWMDIHTDGGQNLIQFSAMSGCRYQYGT